MSPDDSRAPRAEHPAAAGVTLGLTPGGRRLLGVLRAVASGLALDETVRVLPWLRRATQARDDRHDRLSPSRARDIAFGIGMAGVVGADGVSLDWLGRLRQRRDCLLRELANAERAPLGERRRRALDNQAARRWLKDVEPILPGVAALQELAACCATAASVTVAAAAVADFARRSVRMPADPPDLPDVLRTVVAASMPPADAAPTVGRDAVHALAAAVLGFPLALGRIENAREKPGESAPAIAGAEAVDAGSADLSAGPRAANVESVVAATRVQALLAAIAANTSGPLDGFIEADAWATVVPPGLTPQRPLSATAVAALLACPYRFLLERILFLREPPARPAADTVSPIVYGQLFHTAAERFFAVAGPALCKREGSLDTWCAVAAGTLSDLLDEQFLAQPLPVAGAAEAVRERLGLQMAQLVRHEWLLPPRAFVASESTFGDPEPVALEAGAATLYLRGAVDRLDRLASGELALRDLKTGRLWPLDAEPLNPTRDLQLGTYVLALEACDRQGGERIATAAYVSPALPETVQRIFEGRQLEELRRRTREWLGVAGAMLAAGTFPRTVRGGDCVACAFRVVCGDSAWARSALRLSRLPAEHPAAQFARLRGSDPKAIPGTAAGDSLPTRPAWFLRRFLLGLRALADRDDGVAELALLGPPFFAVDLADLVTERAAHGVPVPPGRALRMDAVRAVVDVLRLYRHDRSPGTAARDLVDRSGLGRTIATGAGASESRRLLDEAVAQLDRLANRNGLDFDAVTEPVRDWLSAPDWTAFG
ncbi:PD-(D/E)XK nuclease family protein [Candidatus Binatia bacterium]|nr:PD-(D/E)XK nuclease family protein [Candidatus Binatia bacterium]